MSAFHRHVLIADRDLGTVSVPHRNGVRAIDGVDAGPALVLVRDHGRPTALLDLELDTRTDAGGVLAACEARSSAPATAATWDSTRATARVDIAIATHRRAELVTGAIESIITSLAACPTIDATIIVVDNAPVDDATRVAVGALADSDPRIRYVVEPVPGLACAHNRALAESDAPIVLFTDDDVVVDPEWVTRMVRPFLLDPQVACVTGLIMPFAIDSEAAAYIEEQASYIKGLSPVVVDAADARPDDPLFPLRVGPYGSGANMAFRRTFLDANGGFDPALGAGTIARGGDDLAAFFDVLVAGGRLAFEPAAIVYHRHHGDFAALLRSARHYGVGLGAYGAHAVARDRRAVLGALRHVAATVRHAKAVSPGGPSRLDRRQRLQMAANHALGVATGPVLYAMARRRAAANGSAQGPGGSSSNSSAAPTTASSNPARKSTSVSSAKA